MILFSENFLRNFILAGIIYCFFHAYESSKLCGQFDVSISPTLSSERSTNKKYIYFVYKLYLTDVL